MAKELRCLITGGAGFLGSHLTDRLLEAGHSVVVFDNLITGRADNVAHRIGHERFQLVKQDVTEYLYLAGPLDAVVHFASPASPIDYLKMPIPTLKVGSLGTHKALGLSLAKGARFLLASTSEVYGDPQVHPQPESYWGHVNPVGPRGVYDEAKRFAEAMTMAYHRYHALDTRIVRIFNSVLADETIFLFNDESCHLEAAEDYARSIEGRKLWSPLHIKVPAFDPQTCTIQLRSASAFIKHPAVARDAFRVRTRYGRHIKVTGDHSLFKRAKNGQPVATPVRELAPGDYIAIPAHLPVVERDLPSVNVGEWLLETAGDSQALWGYVLSSPALPAVIERHKDLIFDLLMASPRFDGSRNKRNTVGCSYRKYRQRGILPLAVVGELRRQVGFDWPADAQVALYTGGGSAALPNVVPCSDDLLWLLGFYLAEGCCFTKNGTHFLTFCSDERFLVRAKALIETIFETKVGFVPPAPGRGPSIYSHARLLCELFTGYFGLSGKSGERRVPRWVLQLPLSRLKHFLEGYREGDGSHTNVKERRELAFNTTSEGLATDLTYLLLRFGIVGSLGRYETTYRQRYGDRKFPFWRVTVCEVSDFDVLTWDQGVHQTLNATRTGDLVWVPIVAIEPTEITSYVYDFAVPECENFVAGTGVFAHNTYGPRMRPDDGRVVSNFVVQALRGEPLTVYGQGQQTRSFTYVDDLIEGILRLLLHDDTGPSTTADASLDPDAPPDIHLPVNIGNPVEFTVGELAEKVLALTGSRSRIEYRPLPVDDPKVRRPDIARARRLLAWEPRVPLQEGLERTIPYFRESLGL